MNLDKFQTALRIARTPTAKRAVIRAAEAGYLLSYPPSNYNRVVVPAWEAVGKAFGLTYAPVLALVLEDYSDYTTDYRIAPRLQFRRVGYGNAARLDKAALEQIHLTTQLQGTGTWRHRQIRHRYHLASVALPTTKIRPKPYDTRWCDHLAGDVLARTKLSAEAGIRVAMTALGELPQWEEMRAVMSAALERKRHRISASNP